MASNQTHCDNFVSRLFICQLKSEIAGLYKAQPLPTRFDSRTTAEKIGEIEASIEQELAKIVVL